MPTRPAIDRSLLIDGLGKGLRVIELFSDAHPRLTATEAGQLAGLTRTAARRYLLSLVHFGYADTDGKHYWLLPSVLRLGQSYLEAARVPRLVRPFLQQLSMQTGETANMSVLDGHEVVYLARSNSPRVLSIGFHAGARVPAHVVSAGFAILSTLDDASLEAWIAGHAFGRFTGETVTDAAQFRSSVGIARSQGFWLSGSYIDIGLRGIAAPVFDRQGRCAGAVSMTFQTQAYPDDKPLTALWPALRHTVQQVREVL